MGQPIIKYNQDTERLEVRKLHLTAVDRDIFIQALLTPPKASDNLLRAADQYKKDVESK